MAFKKIITSKNFAGVFGQEYPEPPLVFFIHIPKTAGTSFRRELEILLQPATNVYPDYTKTDEPIRFQRPELVRELNKRDDLQELRLATGHMPYSEARNISGRPVALLTFLREPVERMISDYRYQLSDAHPMKEIARKRWTDFEAFVSHQSTSNKMYRFLAMNNHEPVDEVISRLEEKFLFVGILEKYELCFRFITETLGLQSNPNVYANRALPNNKAQTEFSDSIMARMAEQNDKDYAIYNHFKSLWEKQEEQILTILDQKNRFSVLRSAKKLRSEWRRWRS